MPAKIHQNNIKTICLPFNPKSLNQKLTVIGFGLTEMGESSDQLRKVNVALRDNDECSDELRLNQYRKLDETQICAGGEN